MTNFRATKEDLMRARILAPDRYFVGLYLPVDFKIGAFNYFCASRRLFQSMEQAIPADDRVLAPALTLYRQSVELSLKSIFQQIHFGDADISIDEDFAKEIARKYSHDLKKLFEAIVELPGHEKIPEVLSNAVRELVNFLSEESTLPSSLRFGVHEADAPADAFPIRDMHEMLHKSWINLDAFVYAAIQNNLKSADS